MANLLIYFPQTSDFIKFNILFEKRVLDGMYCPQIDWKAVGNSMWFTVLCIMYMYVFVYVCICICLCILYMHMFMYYVYVNISNLNGFLRHALTANDRQIKAKHNEHLLSENLIESLIIIIVC